MKYRVTTLEKRSDRVIAPDLAFKNEKGAAIRAFKDFMFYKEPGYTPELLGVLENAHNGAEIRDVLRKARAAS